MSQLAPLHQPEVAIAPVLAPLPTVPANAVTPLQLSPKLLWSVLVVFCLVWLYALGVRTLVPPDEGRYAEMAREMLASGDWITTRLNGIKYFEKPPLQTWMNALTFATFGLGDWQARLWTGLCGLGGVLLTAYAGLRVFNARVGLYAGLVLGASLFWVAAGQINSLDMGLSGMTTLALCALLLGQRGNASATEQRNWMLLCWAAMALAVLAKGLIGVVLPGAVLVLYSIAARDLGIWSRLHLGKGLLVFFAVAAPWFVLVGIKNPEQPHFFFIVEHFQRFLTPGHQRTGAWSYFLVPLAVGMTPWLGLLPQSLLAAVFAKRPHGAFQPRLLLLIWAGFIFFFFSYSSSKLPGYIVPIFPALALLVALYLETASARQRQVAGAITMLYGLAGLIFVPMAPRLVGRPGEMDLILAYQPWVLAAAVLSLAGGAAMFVLAQRPRLRDLGVLLLAGAGFLSTQAILAGFEPYGKHRAALNMVAPINAELRPGATLYMVGLYEQSLPFYLRRTATLVAYTDEFAFGLEQQPELSISQLDDFVTAWRARADAGHNDVAVLRADLYDELLERGVPLRLVARDTRRVVIASRPAP